MKIFQISLADAFDKLTGATAPTSPTEVQPPDLLVVE